MEDEVAAFVFFSKENRNEAMSTVSTSPPFDVSGPDPIPPVMEPDDSYTPSPQNAGPSPTPAHLPALLNLSFNQDHGCFSAGTDLGFRIYNCDPFNEISVMPLTSTPSSLVP